jgi:uncharacterized membrane protein YhfC
MNKYLILLSIVALPNCLHGRPLFQYTGHETADQDTTYYEFNFSMAENGDRMIMDLRSDLDQGELNVWFGGGGYEVIGNYTGEAQFSHEGVMFGPLNNQEPVHLKITATHASGTWSVSFREISSKHALTAILISGILVILIVIGFTIWWKKSVKAQCRWLFIGAGVWFIGVVMKFIVATYANQPVLASIESLSGKTGYLVIGSVYIGLLTGVFEIGITLVLALLVKRMYENADHALSVGLGAGLVEALLIGFSSLANYFMVITGSAQSEAIMGALAHAAAATPALYLVSSVERFIAILCHMSSRFLVLFALAQRKARYFWVGFLLMTALDAIAGYVHLAGLVNKISMWWVELTLLPFAVISIFIIKWVRKRWVSSDPEGNLSKA